MRQEVSTILLSSSELWKHDSAKADGYEQKIGNKVSNTNQWNIIEIKKNGEVSEYLQILIQYNQWENHI